MTPIERTQYLIDRLAGGNKATFARIADIRPDSLSHAIAGRTNIEHYFPRITAAWPNVRKEWLYNDSGEPMWEDYERKKVLEKLDYLIGEVAELKALLKKK